MRFYIDRKPAIEQQYFRLPDTLESYHFKLVIHCSKLANGPSPKAILIGAKFQYGIGTSNMLDFPPVAALHIWHLCLAAVKSGDFFVDLDIEGMVRE